MNLFESIILGIVEGLTEFLPISSTGHLTLVSHFLGVVQNSQFIFFEVAIQLGAIGAVLVYYWKSFLDFEKLKLLAAAFIPTAVVGFVGYKLIKHLLTQESLVAVVLILGGLIILFVEKWYKQNVQVANSEKMTLKQAFILGLAQSLAVVPGVSRSGAMIVSGLLLKMERSKVAEFTFLLAVPTMLSATFYLALKEREVLMSVTSADWVVMVVGFVTSFAVALLVVKFLLSYIRKNDFRVFGYYRICFGLIVLALLYLR